jgi:histone deacetylase 1/2
VEFLNSVTPDNQDEFIMQMRRFNLGPVGEADCPVFDGMFDYCSVNIHILVALLTGNALCY